LIAKVIRESRKVIRRKVALLALGLPKSDLTSVRPFFSWKRYRFWRHCRIGFGILPQGRNLSFLEMTVAEYVID
jgi:hypothetical protein